MYMATYGYIAAKWEIARYEQFLLLPHLFFISRLLDRVSLPAAC